MPGAGEHSKPAFPPPPRSAERSNPGFAPPLRPGGVNGINGVKGVESVDGVTGGKGVNGANGTAVPPAAAGEKSGTAFAAPVPPGAIDDRLNGADTTLANRPGQPHTPGPGGPPVPPEQRQQMAPEDGHTEQFDAVEDFVEDAEEELADDEYAYDEADYAEDDELDDYADGDYDDSDYADEGYEDENYAEDYDASGESAVDDADDEPELLSGQQAKPEPAAEQAAASDQDDQGDEDDEQEQSPARQWLVVGVQLALGVVGGAAVWLLFNWLWNQLPVVALGTALVVTAGLVWIVRKIRKAEDMQTTLMAVLVGLVVTVSPAMLLLLSR